MKYAVHQSGNGWLMDTCAGGTWTFDVDKAVWFDSTNEAYEALHAADMIASRGAIDSIRVLRVK